MFLVFMFNKYLWTTSSYLYPILLFLNFSIRLAIRNGITWSVSFRPSELNLNPSLLRSKTPEATKSSQESVQFTSSHRLHLDPTSDSLQSSCVSPSEVLWTLDNVTPTLFTGYHVACDTWEPWQLIPKQYRWEKAPRSSSCRDQSAGPLATFGAVHAT